MDADIATSIFHQQKLIWDDLSDHQFDTPARTRGQPDNLDDHSFDTPASSTGQPHNLALTTRPAIEPNPPKKRRRLAYLKCDLCRGAKKKCEPSERQWPGEKCQRCDAKGFACSAPAKKRSGIYDAPSVDNTSSVAAVDNNNSLVAASEQDQHEQRAYCALAEKCIQKMRNGLKTNICGLPNRTTDIGAISRTLIDNVLSEDLQYSCRFWISHLCRGKNKFWDDIGLQCQVYQFLTGYLLQWLEALALLELTDDGIASLESLERLALPAEVSERLLTFVENAIRYMLDYRTSLKQFPITVYDQVPQRLLTSLTRQSYILGVEAGSESDVYSIPKWIPSPMTVLRLPTGSVSDAAFSPDGKLLATASGNMIVKLWDTTTGKLSQLLKHSDAVRTMTFSPDGNLLACVVRYGSRGCVQLWQPATGKEQQLLPVPPTKIRAITFSPDGKLLVSTIGGEWIAMWDLVAREKPRLFKLGQVSSVYSWPDTVNFSPDRKVMAKVVGKDIGIWNICTECEIRTLAAHDIVSHIAFSLDSRLLFATRRQ